MFVQLIEDVAKYLVFESIRDESLGDLWEADYRLKRSGTPKIIRLAKITWNFILIIKASITIFVYEKIEKISKSQGFDSLGKESSDCYIFDNIELRSQEIEEIRSYCYTRKLYNSFLSKRLLKSSITPESYWISQTERIIKKCQSQGCEIDCEAIINNFMLSSLVRKIESIPPGNVNIKILNDLVRSTNLTNEFIGQYVEFDDRNYKRQLIFRTWSLAVYVISWKPGQESWAHHHGYALDVIKVIQGQMTHWHISPENLENKVPFECFRNLKNRYEGPSETFYAGDIVTVDRCQGHQIGNLSNENLVTLHFRFGPPPEDEHWRSTNDTEMFIWNQTEGYFDLIRRDNGYAPAR